MSFPVTANGPYSTTPHATFQHARTPVLKCTNMKARSNKMTPREYAFLGVAGLFLAVAGVLGYLFYELTNEHEALAAKERETNAALASTTEALLAANTTIGELTGTLDDTEGRLAEEKDRNDAFEEQIDDITSTVSDLDKLSKTDEELLQKYSKVYFLNEHYVPSDISDIDDALKYTETKDMKLHSKAMPFFEDMLEDAKADGIDLWAVSSYRSFNEQAVLKGAYSVTYGSGANAFSADQGYSEHQLGTTVDLTTSGLSGGLVTSFENTPAFAWLQENAHKYGFTLSYPKGNAYYVYEPWHWRFVGEELAEDLHEAGAHFYDWDQRKIDTYLLHIFD